MASLPRIWFTAGANPELWGSKGTYAPVPFEWLPPVDSSRHDGSFDWLAEAPQEGDLQYGLGDVDDSLDDADILKRMDALITLAEDEGLALPRSFVTLFSRRDLFERVPTCTACYLELPTKLIELDGQPGRLLRFMNDQQCVLVWLLQLLPGGGHSIIAAVPDFSDSAEGDTLEDVATFVDPVVCADDFEEFIHRFWLENTLWCAVRDRRSLTREETNYVAHARRRRT